MFTNITRTILFQINELLRLFLFTKQPDLIPIRIQTNKHNGTARSTHRSTR